MKKPFNQHEIFKALSPLRAKMLKHREKGHVSLTADEIETMKSVYSDIQVLSSGGLPIRFNSTCSSCVADIFRIYTSFYDRLESNPVINPDAQPQPIADTVFDYDMLFESMRNAWVKKKEEYGEDFEIDEDGASDEIQRVFEDIKSETLEGWAESRGMEKFDVNDFTGHLIDMFIWPKPQPQPVPEPEPEPTPEEIEQLDALAKADHEAQPIAQHIAESFPAADQAGDELPKPERKTRVKKAK